MQNPKLMKTLLEALPKVMRWVTSLSKRIPGREQTSGVMIVADFYLIRLSTLSCFDTSQRPFLQLSDFP
jgi:hypothetical protein